MYWLSQTVGLLTAAVSTVDGDTLGTAGDTDAVGASNEVHTLTR